MRSFKDVKFGGYIADNLKITKNGFAYLEIDQDILEKYNIDAATAGNMVMILITLMVFMLGESFLLISKIIILEDLFVLEVLLLIRLLVNTMVEDISMPVVFV